jgi:hypothetical protein
MKATIHHQKALDMCYLLARQISNAIRLCTTTSQSLGRLGKYAPPKLHVELSGVKPIIQRDATPRFSSVKYSDHDCTAN